VLDVASLCSAGLEPSQSTLYSIDLSDFISGEGQSLRDARTLFIFIAIKLALCVMISACEAVITSLAVSENRLSHRAKYLSSMGKGK
jgi:hypothetical protein